MPGGCCRPGQVHRFRLPRSCYSAAFNRPASGSALGPDQRAGQASDRLADPFAF